MLSTYLPLRGSLASDVYKLLIPSSGMFFLRQALRLSRFPTLLTTSPTQWSS
jgi:hypothetical protein